MIYQQNKEIFRYLSSGLNQMTEGISKSEFSKETVVKQAPDCFIYLLLWKRSLWSLIHITAFLNIIWKKWLP